MTPLDIQEGHKYVNNMSALGTQNDNVPNGIQ